MQCEYGKQKQAFPVKREDCTVQWKSDLLFYRSVYALLLQTFRVARFFISEIYFIRLSLIIIHNLSS